MVSHTRFLRGRVLLLCVFSMLALACNLPTAFGELYKLSSDIHDHFGVDRPGVDCVNGQSLLLSFANSPYNDLGGQEQKDQAREIARFVKSRIPQYGTLAGCTVIDVRFVKSTSFLFFHSNRYQGFRFTLKELTEQGQPEVGST